MIQEIYSSKNMFSGYTTTLIDKLIEANANRDALAKIQVFNSTSDVNNLSDLCFKFLYTVIFGTTALENGTIEEGDSDLIIISSNWSKQNRIFILNANKITLDKITSYLNLIIATSPRKIFGMKDIRRAILLAESREFFATPENIKKWDRIIGHVAIASALDITFGQLHLPVFQS